MSNPEPAPIRVRGRCLAWGRRTYVMSILNITPDSFSGTGPGLDPDAALERAQRDIADGADMLDIGGESTRPGATPVDAGTELRRVLPVIERLAAVPNVLISIDTTKPEVADAALRAGAAILNDIHGLRGDPRMAEVAARHGAPIIAMANLRDCRYADVVEAVRCQFRESLAVAGAAGIPRDRVILDPGFGFGPPTGQNLELIRRLRSLRELGRPLLVGTSRKSTIGRVLDLPVEERLEGTAATVAVAIVNGVDIIRVHDTRSMVRVARMTDAIVRGWRDPEQDPDGAPV
ncbi:MAG: dihydropteroate synthase [Dehalococcoidia bacterium]